MITIEAADGEAVIRVFRLAVKDDVTVKMATLACAPGAPSPSK